MQINSTELHCKEHLGLKKLVRFCLIIFFLLPLVLTSRVLAQEIEKEGTASQLAIILKIDGLYNDQTVLNLETAFTECGSKILSYSIDKNNQIVRLVISQKLKPVDVLEVLASHGIRAGYFNDRREYFTLDKEGELTEPLIIDK